MYDPHLLLGLLREMDGVAALILMNLGASLNKVRAEIVSILKTDIADNSIDSTQPDLLTLDPYEQDICQQTQAERLPTYQPPQQWEYQFVREYFINEKRSPTDISAFLNGWGKDGWELITSNINYSCDLRGNSEIIVAAIFKRPKNAN